MSKVTMVDPPSGWRYGFPKIVPAEVREKGGSIIPWLVENGYPQREVAAHGDHFYCRYWEQEINEGE